MTIKNPNVVRDKVLNELRYAFKHLYSMLSFLPETEVDVMRCLELPQVHDLEIELTNLLMAKFGHEAKPKEAKFDKTRRRLNQKRLKGPRGEPGWSVDGRSKIEVAT